MRAGIPVAQALNRRPACVLLATCGVLLLVLIAARGGTGLAGSIDTFVLAGLIPILLMDRDAATLRRIETVFHLMMLANAMLGLFEFADEAGGTRYTGRARHWSAEAMEQHRMLGSPSHVGNASSPPSVRFLVLLIH